MVRNKANSPSAAGKPRVISGIRLPCTALVGRRGFSAVGTANSVPHTRQRAASMLTRVPQVGQIFVGVEGLSTVIALKATLRLYQPLWRGKGVKKPVIL